MDPLDKARGLLRPEWEEALMALDRERIEEIRLRRGQAPQALIDGREQALAAPPVSGEALQRVLEKATGASLHTAAAALAEGFVSYKGLRIGVCGTAVLRGGEPSGFRCLSSLAIRLPREYRDMLGHVLRRVCRGGFQSTLVLAPPGGGKTTALRELIRVISDSGTRVGVVDERNELAAMDGDMPQFDLGGHSDVLTGLPKARGAMMLLRGMNPQILAMDEISREEDLDAVTKLCGCGVQILASAHGSGVQELRRRPVYRELLDKRVFRYFVTISGSGAQRCYSVQEAAE